MNEGGTAIIRPLDYNNPRGFLFSDEPRHYCDREVLRIREITAFFKKEAVLCIAVILAVISMFFVPPDGKYIDYIDFRTLSILFCLMAVMSGLREIGVFDRLSAALVKKCNSLPGITIILNLLCFFLSMVITNDVALLTFVPFALVILKMINVKKGYPAILIIMLTISANMGSMLTPLGNPQNLYLYGRAGLSFAEFIKIMLPYTALALLVLMGWIMIYCRKGGKISVSLPDTKPVSTTKLAIYSLLFIVSLLAVLRIYSYLIPLIAVIILMAVFDYKNYLRIDYSLLLTFVAFFVFIGNMGRLPVFKGFLEEIVNNHVIATGIISSQVISNVPAALLLSGFTESYRNLLVAVNLGGLGTLIASMASLISYKIYVKENIGSKGRYLLFFSIANICFLIILIALNIIIS